MNRGNQKGKGKNFKPVSTANWAKDMKSSDITENLYYNYHKILSCAESKLNFVK